MEHGRYEITLGAVPAEIVEIAQLGVPVGYLDRHTEPGFLLADGTALLESEKDDAGFYVGGAGMDGMFLRTNERYEPVRNEDGAVTTFRRMSEFLPRFSAEEQALIYQYGMNTRDNLVADLTAALPVLAHSPQVRELFASTAEKLKLIPPEDCRRLMADIRAAYKGRSEQSIRDRERAARKPAAKKKRSVAR